MQTLAHALQLVLHRLNALPEHTGYLVSGQPTRIEHGHLSLFLRHLHAKPRLTDNAFMLADAASRTPHILKVQQPPSDVEVQRVVLSEVAADKDIYPSEVEVTLVGLRGSAFFIQRGQRFWEIATQRVKDELDDLAVALTKHTLLSVQTVAHLALPQVELYCLHCSCSMIGCSASSSAAVKFRRPANLSLMVM